MSHAQSVWRGKVHLQPGHRRYKTIRFDKLLKERRLGCLGSAHDEGNLEETGFKECEVSS
ncbi:hypothetical protein C8R44DRAFT_787017 [Mycena epipterygia]|nr:hypothetical protein C8R44DRAFT_787017 [Mycena epipterygia]